MRPDGKNTVMKGLTEKEVLHMAQHKKYYIWLNRQKYYILLNRRKHHDSYAKSFARFGEL